MKLQNKWVLIITCPTTKEIISDSEYINSGGLCPRCGDLVRILCHGKRTVGKLTVVNWFNRIFKRVQPKFYTKSEILKIESPEDFI